MDSDADRDSCPECGQPLPADARFCPGCQSAISADGSAVDIGDIDGITLPSGPELVTTDDRGRARAARPVRVLAGLAVSIPLAPLVLFLVGNFLPLTSLTAVLTFMAGWLLPAAYLSRARVPAAAFAKSLYLIGVGTALVPGALIASGTGDAATPLSIEFGTIAAACAVVAIASVLLGAFVSRQAAPTITGRRRTGVEES